MILHLIQFFALSFMSISSNVYGAVAAICEEFESHQDGSGEPEILMRQSIVRLYESNFMATVNRTN